MSFVSAPWYLVVIGFLGAGLIKCNFLDTSMISFSLLSNMGTFGTLLVNTIFAGRMANPADVAAIGLSNVCCTILILSLMIGINSA